MTTLLRRQVYGYRLGTWCLLLLVLAGYGFLHIPWLQESAFNDEAFCYYPGILHQWDQGVGLLPASVPPELSRGHPTLFFALYGLWAKVAGSGILSMRILSLLISLKWLGAVWVLAAWLTRPQVAWLLLALLMVQPIVFVQSTLILPEMLVALLFTLMLLAWLRRQWLLYILWGSLLAWTKETTLVFFPLLAGGTLLLQLLKAKGPGQHSWKTYSITLIPLGAGLLYLLLQKLTWGFWLFPQHRGVMIYQDLPYRILGLVGPELWAQQGRWWWTLLWLAAPLVYLLQCQKLLKVRPWPDGRLAPGALCLFGILIIGYVVMHSPFLAVMRYYLCLIPLLLLGGLQLCRAAPWQWALPAAWLAGLVVAGYALVYPDDRVDEVNLNYADQNACDLAAVRWMTGQGIDRELIYTQLVFRRKLVYPYNGYVAQPFGAVTLEPETDWTYYVVTADFATRWQGHMYRDAQELTTLPDTRLVRRFEQGKAWTVIYKRVK
ncbi:MAG: hypothetical protein KF690_07870 [Bacteroidetes bacterium]|nr:hypothetical protein [Bacteroidota bacterium]